MDIVVSTSFLRFPCAREAFRTLFSWTPLRFLPSSHSLPYLHIRFQALSRRSTQWIQGRVGVACRLAGVSAMGFLSVFQV